MSLPRSDALSKLCWLDVAANNLLMIICLQKREKITSTTLYISAILSKQYGWPGMDKLVPWSLDRAPESLSPSLLSQPRVTSTGNFTALCYLSIMSALAGRALVTDKPPSREFAVKTPSSALKWLTGVHPVPPALVTKVIISSSRQSRATRSWWSCLLS